MAKGPARAGQAVRSAPRRHVVRWTRSALRHRRSEPCRRRPPEPQNSAL